MSKPSKVIFGNQTIIDLTSDTVDAAHLLSGYTATGADGEPVVGACTYDADTSDGTAVASEILATKSAYVNGTKVVGTMPNNAETLITLYDKDIPLPIPAGYHDGSGRAIISAIESVKLKPNNIRKDITILGVTGEMTGSEDVKSTDLTITPYTTSQTIVPGDLGDYNYFSEVTVSAIAYSEVDNAAGGKTVTIGTVAP